MRHHFNLIIRGQVPELAGRHLPVVRRFADFVFGIRAVEAFEALFFCPAWLRPLVAFELPVAVSSEPEAKKLATSSSPTADKMEMFSISRQSHSRSMAGICSTRVVTLALKSTPGVVSWSAGQP